MFRRAIAWQVIAGGLLVCGIIYLSWIPSPRMIEVGWMPGWLTRWADAHDQLRTAVPFFLFGGLIGFAGVPRRRGAGFYGVAWLALTLLVTAVELRQLSLPRRVFDGADIFWGSVGAGVGLGIAVMGAEVLKPILAMMKTDDEFRVVPVRGEGGAENRGAANAPLYFMGLRFWNGETDALLREMDQKGGMLAVPSAPSLAQAAEDPLLQTAYRESEWCVMDGGYVALVVRLLGRSVRRISGLQLIEKITAASGDSPIPLRERSILWVVPSRDEEERIGKFLSEQSFDSLKQSYYLAPFYRRDEDFNDRELVAQVQSSKPDWIILCLGGGRQEKLGYFLKKGRTQVDDKRPDGPVILCTGAAIAFFTGGQARIPTWADRMYLGWLFRVIEKPGAFLPRYVKAGWHFPLALWRQRGTWFDLPQGDSRGNN